ncbi:MAG TPA: tripartite tricarboxylate transporter substrate binding protein [Anaerolineales bacterium]|nr:MAG: hypothetical protein A3G24_12375 [Betaproteobacteria bacterium RIFCSPLOWO2_12_FULL_62_13]HLB48396.1 tripartite tricarboxylate transporter substrate binding protein [Anaerolineales bacterium]
MRWIKLPTAGVLVGLVLSSLAMAAENQPYPTRPIRFIVPFSPGGGTDFIGRLVALKLAEALGQSVVVDNRSGAGGTIGTNIAAKAPADGYTILLSPIGLAVNVTLYEKLPYDTLKDLAPVSMLGHQPNILVVHPSVPANSVGELLALVRSKPGQISYASGGFGAATYLAAELLKLMAKIEMVHVPFKGSSPALRSVIGGEVQVFLSTFSLALPQVKAGKVKALAVTTAKRSIFLPEVPTMDEAGVAGYEYRTWYGLLVPAGTSQPIISRLNTEVVKIITSTGIKEQLSMQGVETTPTSPEQFGAFIRSEIAKWRKVLRATGAKPQ